MSANATPRDPAAMRRSGPSSSFSHLSASDPADGADPDRAEKNAISLRTPGYLMPGQERQQRQIGAGERKESKHAHQCRAQPLIVDGMAHARADRADQTLRGQALGGFPRLPPPDQGCDDHGVAGREDPERDGDPCRSDDQAAERRPGGAPDIEADAIQGRRAVQILLGHQERSGRRPGGRGQCSAHPEQEGRRQQKRRRREVQRNQAGENHRDRQNREFDRDQQPPGIDDVRQGAGGQGEQEQGQADGDLDQGHGHRIGVEVGDQPAGRCVEHGGADVRHDACGPYERECD